MKLGPGWGRRLLALAMIATLAGCSLLSSREEDEDTSRASAQALYEDAHSNLESGNYQTAITKFEDLEARYPFSRHAQQGLLETAYAYYKFDEPESAIAAADRFIRTYPNHRNLDYALYIKGLANFHSNDNFLDRFFTRDPANRDASSTRRSFLDFSELVRRFPQSRYAADARQRMIYLRNTLARHELNVGDYYYRREAYLAAANRAQGVLRDYASTPLAGDALLMMVKSYRRLGMEKLAADAEQVLVLNDPERHARLDETLPWRQGVAATY